MIGRTNETAWGFTNPKTDSADMFLEKIEGEKYFYEDEWREMTKRMETIKVMGKGNVEFPVYETHHGPVFKGIDNYAEFNKISPNMIPVSLENIAVAWTNLDPIDTSLHLGFNIPKVRTADEFLAESKNNTGVTQCVIWASITGEMAQTVAGSYPLRSDPNVNGRYVKRGDLKQNDWQGRVERDLVPFSKNPEKGYIVNANNKITTDNALTDIGLGMAGTNRADRIT
jgi:penicillin amidase